MEQPQMAYPENNEEHHSLTKDLMHLQALLARTLIERLTSRDVSAAELNVVRQFLKDNNIDATPAPDSNLEELVAELPVFDE